MRKDRKLTPDEKIDAVEALSMIGDRPLTLVDCVRMSLQLPAHKSASTPLSDAVEGFLRHTLRVVRPSTWEWYEKHLRGLERGFPGATLQQITRRDLLAHVESVGSGRWRVARAMFRWSATQEPPMIDLDPTRQMRPVFRAKSGEIDFLTVDESRRIMSGAGDLAPALALMLFAGIRPHEVAGDHKPPLEWKHIDRKGKIIRIPADIAKTGRARILEGLPANIWSFFPGGTGPVSPISSTQLARHARRLSGREKWTPDALRHSFATYHVALFGDPGRTSLLMGHEGSTTMLYRHYRGLTTQSEGKMFFQIKRLTS